MLLSKEFRISFQRLCHRVCDGCYNCPIDHSAGWEHNCLSVAVHDMSAEKMLPVFCSLLEKKKFSKVISEYHDELNSLAEISIYLSERVE